MCRCITGQPEQKGEDAVVVRSARLLPDGRTVELEFSSLQPVMQMRIKYRLATADILPLEGEIHNTINRVPAPGRRFAE